MNLGMVGLGRMGSNMVRRLLGAGHECVVFDVHPQAALHLAKVRAMGPLDPRVPGHRFSFGVVKAPQALGDLRVLVQSDRRALGFHLGADVQSGLDVLSKAIERALGTRQL